MTCKGIQTEIFPNKNFGADFITVFDDITMHINQNTLTG